MIKHISFEHAMTEKHVIDEMISYHLIKNGIRSSQVINVQLKDVATNLYQIWVWYHD